MTMMIRARSGKASRGRLEGRVVVVTGAAAGVGRAVADLALREGASVGLIARSRPALERMAADLQRAGGRALPLPLDVADPAAVRAAAAEVETAFGPIDVWINAAMVTVFSPISRLHADEVRRVTEVTYLGAVNGVLAALEGMRKRNRGVIVQVGSALAFRGIPLQAPYCGAKYAIRGFTASLRSELIHEHSDVRVTEVHLPAVNTPQFTWARTHLPQTPRPVGKVFQPEVAAEAIIHAALHPGRDYYLGEPSVETILAQSVAPELMDRVMAHDAWEGQFTGAPAEPRPGNLFDPADEAMHAVAGPFTAEAHDRALMAPGPAVRMAGALALAAAGFAAGLALGRGRVAR